ncbi:MAG: sensor histidine kinase [Gammaproteobacteria bacterium]|nr:sensor histidine kinase [Gammaproteobacteria bacterium]MDH5592058.1 sensor histidine kinase [Gammaproteobacteria bacterium]
MNSLEHRLQAGLAISLILLMIVLGWAQYSVVRQLTESFIASRSEHDSQSLLASIQFDANAKPILTESKLGTVYSQPYSGHYYQVTFVNGQSPLHSRSLWDTRLSFSPPPLGQVQTLHQTGPDEQSLLIHIATYNKQGQNLTIAIAEDVGPIYQQLKTYSSIFISIAIFALLLLLLIQRVIVQYSFRPLKQIHVEIQQLSDGQQGRLTEQVPDEIKPLVVAVNKLLSLMTQRLERSRNALGNLAHTLKGPLNLMTQLSDNEKIKHLPDVHDEMQEHTTRMQQIIDHELTRARIAGAGTPGQQFIPSKELPDLIKVLQQIYRDKDLRFDCHVDDGAFANTDRHDMLELLGNVLDNSCKWAKSTIICNIITEPLITITVEDDGPGCSEQQLKLITTRGSRVDESIAGHGLGLSIVKEIAEIYRFDLQLDQSPKLGGLRVQLKQAKSE